MTYVQVDGTGQRIVGLVVTVNSVNYRWDSIGIRSEDC